PSHPRGAPRPRGGRPGGGGGGGAIWGPPTSADEPEARADGGAGGGAGGAGAGARTAARRRASDAAGQRPHGDRAPERRRARGGRVPAGPDGHTLGDAGDRRALELRPRGDGEGDGAAQRLAAGGDGGRVRRQAQRLRRGRLLGDPRL